MARSSTAKAHQTRQHYERHDASRQIVGEIRRTFITTGIPYSHTRIDLSSEEVRNRRPPSVNVIVFTAARCWSYSCDTRGMLGEKKLAIWTYLRYAGCSCLYLHNLIIRDRPLNDFLVSLAD